MGLVSTVFGRRQHLAWRVLQSVDLGTRLINFARARRKAITHGGRTYTFVVPTWLCRFRADTFATKEPETLRWIDGFEEESVLWDVGANVGLYSVYAAKARGCRVYAFEPSVFNLECLARNVSLNSLSSRISVLPIAISDRTGTGTLHMTSTEWGGALSTFEETYGSDGTEIRPVFEYETLAMSLDDVVTRLGIPAPDYVKIDVDGIEHLIVSGGNTVLRGVKSVLIEISNSFREQAAVSSECLERAGLVLEGGSADSPGAEQAATAGTANQIWLRPLETRPDDRTVSGARQ